VTEAHRLVRLLTAGLRWAAVAVVAVLGVAVAAQVAGLRTYTVRSGSMAPAIGVGDLLVSRPIAAGDARTGDVVTYLSRQHGQKVTHRVTGVRRAGEQVALETRGDANSGSRLVVRPVSARLDRVVLRVPRVGFALGAIERPAGSLVAVAGFALWCAGARTVRTGAASSSFRDQIDF
jgi:signal peptidase I